MRPSLRTRRPMPATEGRRRFAAPVRSDRRLFLTRSSRPCGRSRVRTRAGRPAQTQTGNTQARDVVILGNGTLTSCGAPCDSATRGYARSGRKVTSSASPASVQSHRKSYNHRSKQCFPTVSGTTISPHDAGGWTMTKTWRSDRRGTFRGPRSRTHRVPVRGRSQRR